MPISLRFAIHPLHFFSPLSKPLLSVPGITICQKPHTQPNMHFWLSLLVGAAAMSAALPGAYDLLTFRNYSVNILIFDSIVHNNLLYKAHMKDGARRSPASIPYEAEVLAADRSQILGI